MYYDYDKALVVKKDSTVGVFAANKFVPVKLAAESGTYGHKEVYTYIDKYLSDVIGNEGYHDFVVDHKFDYYTYRTAEGAVVAGSDKGIHYRDDSGKSVISVKDAQFLEIERSGDYGLINLMSGKVTDPIYFRPIDVNRFDRYQPVINGDMLTDGRNFYTVREYEIQLRDRFHDVISGFMNYVTGEDLSHDGEYVTPHFYDKCNKAASDYLTDQFLSDEEKIHADEVIELKQKVVTYIDDCLWNELTPLEYAREDLWLKCEDRYHWDEAQAEIAKIVENNPLLIIPQRGPYWSEEKQNVTYEEEWINGNCYLHEIFVSKGFKFRNNALSKKSELILRFKDSETASETDRYFPLESDSYKDYSLVCDSLLTDGSYIAYYIHSHNQEMGDTTMTEQPIYERVSEPYVLKVSPEGKLSAERLLYATVSPLKFRNFYFFINSKGNRSSGTFMLDRWNGVEDGKEQYSTVIDIYDYDFTHKYYMSNEGEFIYDIFKWGDKWLFIGSTLNHGYIGYENCYVVLLDSGLKVIDSLHFTDKDTYLSGVEYVGKNRFRLTGNKGTKWMRVNSDNTMEWLDSLATTTPEVVVAEEQ